MTIMRTLLFLMISALATASVAPAFAGVQVPQPGQLIPIDIVVAQNGSRYVFEIAPGRANQQVAWDRQSDPPLSVGAARKSAEEWLAVHFKDVQTFDLAGVTLSAGGRCGSDPCWHYRLTFDPTVGGRRLIGGNEFTVVVLLDGSVVEPRVETGPPVAAGRGGGPGNGCGAGPGGCRGFAPPAARQSGPPQPGPDGAYRVGNGVAPPQAISNPPAKYPSSAQSARIQGIVILEAVVGTDGKVGDVKVIRSLAAALD